MDCTIGNETTVVILLWHNEEKALGSLFLKHFSYKFMVDLKLLWVPEIQYLKGWCQRCSKDMC